jgi:hypothetical protein
MTPEAKVLKKLVTYLRTLRAAGEPIFWVKNHGSMYSASGIPDLAIVYRGWSIWAEVKAMEGKASELQLHRMEEIRKAGAIVGVVRTVEELQDLLAEVSK